MNRFKKYWYSVLLLFSAFSVFSQDMQFTQFYANPLYLSPSFTGGIVGYRVAANYRNQWTFVPGTFNTFSVSWDHNSPAFRSGFGVMAVRDQAGDGNLANTRMGVLYSYDIEPFPDWHLRPGLAFFLQQISIDFSKLIFSDQLTSTPMPPTSVTQPGKDAVWDIDVSSSILAYSDNMWLGVTWDHMLKPVATFYDDNSRLPHKITVHGGYRYITKGFLLSRIEESFTVAFNYRVQDIYRQLDLGLYFYSQPISFGVWWRGLPKNSVGRRVDALAFMVGYKWEQVSMGYSYDFTISRLGLASGGSHEISMIYEFRLTPKKRWKAIPCPTF
ncbi:PorP/SprF family type IX secretion system membrane protein [Tenuifilum osseticum]|uniref:PorP/SprF family type IX secretion system membrane protein n=1 Tax=Tenuifilum osseticum TaxID=3374723 RepID=UPI0034E52903